MTTYAEEEVKCAVCERKSVQTILNSTNRFGSSDLDLRPPEMQRSTMRTWVQRCRSCGYCAADLSTSTPGASERIREPAYRAILADSGLPELARSFRAQALLTDDATRRAWACLRAAWVCDDAERADRAVECRLLAASAFEELRPFGPDEPSMTPGLVLVDVLRRAGEFGRAETECRSLAAIAGTQNMLADILAEQLRHITARDSGRHLVGENRPVAHQAPAQPRARGPSCPSCDREMDSVHVVSCPNCGRAPFPRAEPARFGQSGSCPRCRFAYRWDGRVCYHCRLGVVDS